MCTKGLNLICLKCVRILVRLCHICGLIMVAVRFELPIGWVMKCPNQHQSQLKDRRSHGIIWWYWNILFYYNTHTCTYMHGPGSLVIQSLMYLNLHEKRDRRALLRYCRYTRPTDIWTSPPCTKPLCIVMLICEYRHNCVLCAMNHGLAWCTCWTSIQVVNMKRYGHRPFGECDAYDLLMLMRRIHKQQLKRGGRSHHEQSAKSRLPCVLASVFSCCIAFFCVCLL